MVTQIGDALRNLNPKDLRAMADRQLTVELASSTEEGYKEIARFLVPESVSDEKRKELRVILFRAGDAPRDPDLRIAHVSASPFARDVFIFDPAKPERVVNEILEAREDLHVPLARNFPPFRQPVVDKIIQNVSKENALFTLATAVPSILPLISLPWAIGEFASDTAFLTMNQIRMCFLLAAASDRKVGYKEQRNEIASFVVSAFGWRALARELVGKIPMGGGLIPKAAIAWSGTYVVGSSVERFYRLGYGYTEPERKKAYEAAFEKGKSVVGSLAKAYKLA
jgi:hypothetical protein